MIASLLVRRPLLLLLVVLVSVGLVACEGEDNPNNPTPASLTSSLEVFGSAGLAVSNVVSGDPGCADQSLAGNAISFNLRGFDQTTPTRVYLYGFKNRATFQRLASTVDACARSYATDPAAYGNIQASPFILAGPGPWAPTFEQHLRTALTKAAGNGG